MKLNLSHKGSTILYGILLALMLFILKWLELKFIIINYSFEIYAGSIALIFTLLGIWLAIKLTKPKSNTVIIEKQVYINNSNGFIFNEAECNKLNISNRELEVLQLMAQGFSNKEIGEQLFVSINTIKTHSSNLFEKLELKRRTQAIEKAKRLALIS